MYFLTMQKVVRVHRVQNFLENEKSCAHLDKRCFVLSLASNHKV